MWLRSRTMSRSTPSSRPLSRGSRRSNPGSWPSRQRAGKGGSSCSSSIVTPWTSSHSRWSARAMGSTTTHVAPTLLRVRRSTIRRFSCATSPARACKTPLYGLCCSRPACLSTSASALSNSINSYCLTSTKGARSTRTLWPFRPTPLLYLRPFHTTPRPHPRPCCCHGTTICISRSPALAHARSLLSLISQSPVTFPSVIPTPCPPMPVAPTRPPPALAQAPPLQRRHGHCCRDRCERNPLAARTVGTRFRRVPSRVARGRHRPPPGHFLPPIHLRRRDDGWRDGGWRRCCGRHGRWFARRVRSSSRRVAGAVDPHIHTASLSSATDALPA